MFVCLFVWIGLASHKTLSGANMRLGPLMDDPFSKDLDIQFWFFSEIVIEVRRVFVL